MANDPLQSQDNHGPLLLGVSWGLTSLATIFLGLRLYCKLSTGRRLWWDDWVLIAGWVRFLPSPFLLQSRPVSNPRFAGDHPRH
jgi:hypothetical protein